ncbi:MAG: hypothetical protein R2831_04575 [Chitinophagaceae bacterium]
MYKYILGLSFFFVAFLSACRKPNAPEPLICNEKTIFSVKDTIKMSSCSKNAETYRWVLPDGSTSTLESVYFVAPQAGSYLFTLYVSNPKFVNEYKATQTITVNP